MATLLLTRGLPGSGKTTAARRWVRDRTQGERCYIDRDDLRVMMFGRWGLLTLNEENAVTVAQHSAIAALLRVRRSVAVADTFLREDRLQPMYMIAEENDATVEIMDLRHVPVSLCIQRDAERGAAGGRHVGADVIIDMARRAGLASSKEVL